MARRADDVARELNLDFDVEEPAKSSMPVLRFTFRFPDSTEKPSEYVAAVRAVTQWSKRVKAWTFEHFGTQPIVATELTFGNRVKVALVNRKNRKRIDAFNSVEARARRSALTQPTPQQALKVLDEQAPGAREKETRRLRLTLEESARILERAASEENTGSVH